MNRRSWWFGTMSVALLGASMLPGPATAQSPPDSAATRAMRTAPLLRGGEMGELLSVYVPRAESELRRLLEESRNLERSAGSEVDNSRRLATEADGRARIMKEEIETTKVRRDVAKKSKDKTAQSELDATSKRQSRELDYLENLRDALRADADRLESERAAAAARAKALELELRVTHRNAEIGSAPVTAETASQYRSLLREMLEAYKQSADRWADASGKRKRVAERRLKQLESLSKLAR